MSSFSWTKVYPIILRNILKNGLLRRIIRAPLLKAQRLMIVSRVLDALIASFGLVWFCFSQFHCHELLSVHKLRVAGPSGPIASHSGNNTGTATASFRLLWLLAVLLIASCVEDVHGVMGSAQRSTAPHLASRVARMAFTSLSASSAVRERSSARRTRLKATDFLPSATPLPR